jgi:tungstate transport system permease protein
VLERVESRDYAVDSDGSHNNASNPLTDIFNAIRLAIRLLISYDPALLQIVALSLGVSMGATATAAVAGLPCGAALATIRFPGRYGLVLAANALLGLPPVVVGLCLYLLLSRSGPFGMAGLLFTPGAMVLAQFLLALPIVIALVHRGMEGIWSEFGPALQMDGASPLQSVPYLLAIGRAQILTAVLAGFGRTISEVGAIIIVGGNIAGYTRTMTTAIALETSEGNLAMALALGLVLIAISIVVSCAAFTLSEGRWQRIPVDKES